MSLKVVPLCTAASPLGALHRQTTTSRLTPVHTSKIHISSLLLRVYLLLLQTYPAVPPRKPVRRPRLTQFHLYPNADLQICTSSTLSLSCTCSKSQVFRQNHASSDTIFMYPYSGIPCSRQGIPSSQQGLPYSWVDPPRPRPDTSAPTRTPCCLCHICSETSNLSLLLRPQS